MTLQQSEGSSSQSPLGRALALEESDVDALGALFTEATGALAIDGAGIFSRLRAGKTMVEALQLPKGTLELLYFRAHQWFQIGRPERAETLFRALCMLDGGSADYWVGYGVCLRDRGAATEAEVAFKTAIQLRPDWAIPRFHAFDLAARLGAWDDADAQYSAFKARIAADTPAAIVEEAERLTAAIAMHRKSQRPA